MSALSSKVLGQDQTEELSDQIVAFVCMFATMVIQWSWAGGSLCSWFQLFSHEAALPSISGACAEFHVSVFLVSCINGAVCGCMLQWLNRMLQGMWPYYDKAIGAAIKEAVEPMMEQYKPPGLIKKIYFAKLTFGDAPMRIDNVWVEDEGEQHVLLEVRSLPTTCSSQLSPSFSGLKCSLSRHWLCAAWIASALAADPLIFRPSWRACSIVLLHLCLLIAGLGQCNGSWPLRLQANHLPSLLTLLSMAVRGQSCRYSASCELCPYQLDGVHKVKQHYQESAMSEQLLQWV
jgi:hypothetical protein